MTTTFAGAIIARLDLRVCWNRQTGTFEGRVSMTYGFKSRHSHQKQGRQKTASLFQKYDNEMWLSLVALSASASCGGISEREKAPRSKNLPLQGKKFFGHRKSKLRSSAKRQNNIKHRNKYNLITRCGSVW